MLGRSGIPCPTGFLWHKEQEHNKQFVGWSPLSCCCFLDSIPASLFEFLVFFYFLLLWRTMLLCVRVGSTWALELVWFPPLRWAGKLTNSVFKSLANCSLNPLGRPCGAALGRWPGMDGQKLHFTFPDFCWPLTIPALFSWWLVSPSLILQRGNVFD